MMLPRAVRRLVATAADYDERPPIIVNSLPKSGTHLLLQIVLALPGYRTFGAFIATTPSITMRRRSDGELARRIMKLVPGEICGAHLYFSDVVADAIRQRGAISLFIYRDPRDVFWSEMQYLISMNYWHRAARIARRIRDEDERFKFFLKGLPASGRFVWPNFSNRVVPYLGWLTHSSTFCCRYEDFTCRERVGPTLEALAGYLATRLDVVRRYGEADIARRLRNAIRPEFSHTFRSGRRHEWRLKMKKEHIQALEREVETVVASISSVSPIHTAPGE